MCKSLYQITVHLASNALTKYTKNNCNTTLNEGALLKAEHNMKTVNDKNCTAEQNLMNLNAKNNSDDSKRSTLSGTTACWHNCMLVQHRSGVTCFKKAKGCVIQS